MSEKVVEDDEGEGGIRSDEVSGAGAGVTTEGVEGSGGGIVEGVLGMYQCSIRTP